MSQTHDHSDAMDQYLTGEFERCTVGSSQRIGGESLKAAFSKFNENSPNEYALITESGRVITVERSGSHCSACNANKAYSPSRGTPPETAQQERAKNACQHAAVASNLPFETQCDCGSWEMEERGPFSMKHCANCGDIQ